MSSDEPEQVKGKHPESSHSLTIWLPDWAINSITFIIATWITFSLLMSLVNHLESNKSERWKQPIEHTNPLKQ